MYTVARSLAVVGWLDLGVVLQSVLVFLMVPVHHEKMYQFKASAFGYHTNACILPSLLDESLPLCILYCNRM